VLVRLSVCNDLVYRRTDPSVRSTFIRICKSNLIAAFHIIQSPSAMQKDLDSFFYLWMLLCKEDVLACVDVLLSSVYEVICGTI